MSSRKRNDFLDIESSDNDEGSEGGYDSEQAEETKGRSKGSVKRRKLSSDEDSGEEASDRENDEENESQPPSDHEEWDDSPGEGQYNESTEEGDTPTSTSKSTTKQPSSLKKPRKNKTGVIYFSSLPPYLKPTALNSMLTARGFGPITKVFLSPAVKPSSKHTGSGPSGKGNRRRMYSDGWVEFASKRTAKICAETLNATIVGGKKGGWYHDDIWNMKYLRGFKWTDLMEQVQREKKEAEARKQIEDARARKEEKMFISGVEKGRAVDGMKKKREEKGRRKDTADSTDATTTKGGEKQKLEAPMRAPPDVRRVFRQNEVRSGSEKRQRDTKIDPDAQRVLGKIF